MDTIDTASVAVSADTSAFTASLSEAEAAARSFSTNVGSAFSGAEVPARSFSSAIGDAFTSAVVKGRDLDDVLAGLGQRLSNMALSAALKPLEQGLSSTMSQVLSGSFASGGVLQGGAVRPFADGGVLGGVRAFADGGVVASPTYFPMASGVGLMGEAGAEAILPLTRGADGALGVRTHGGGGGGTTVNVSVSTPDTGTFRKSDAYLAGLISRAVARGQRSL